MAFSAAVAAAPQGTAGAHTTVVTPGLSRSANEVICFGLFGATAICGWFVA